MLIKHNLKSNNELVDIKCWIRDNEIDAQVGQVVINPATFEPLVSIMINNEEALTAFYLRWGK